MRKVEKFLEEKAEIIEKIIVRIHSLTSSIKHFFKKVWYIPIIIILGILFTLVVVVTPTNSVPTSDFKNISEIKSSPANVNFPKIERPDTIGDIWITGVIEDDDAISFLKILDDIEHMPKVKVIRVFIYSPGGSVDASLAIADAIINSRKKILTISLGQALSGGAYILCAGDVRYATEHGSIMLHGPMAGLMGVYKIEDLEKRIKQLKKDEDKLFDLLSKKTGKSIKQIREDLKNDKWFTTEEAIEYGIVDSIWKN